MALEKMKVEIWSDIMCPFCYMGKRKFENALSEFGNHDHIDVVWKSFQLAPEMKTMPDKNINAFLAEHKGITLEQASRMNDQVAGMAKKLGLDYHFDKAIPANSFNAHRFSHLAKDRQVQEEAEEMLFTAYFTEGKNVDNLATLATLGSRIGIDPNEVIEVLETSEYAREVHEDIEEARELGIGGVPFFVFDRKFAVSGAQDSSVFLDVLKKSYSAFEQEAAQ